MTATQRLETALTEAEGEVLALDMGGSKMALATVTRDGTLSRHVRKPTAELPNGEALVAWVAEQARAFGLAPEAIGISSGGPLDDVTGSIVSWPRMEHLWGFPLAARLTEALPSLKAVRLVNDASAACAGEVVFGAAQGLSRVLYLTISTGVGGGAVVGGMLLRGDRGNAAEFGHMIVAPGGPRCDCGGRGCLEAMASGSGLYRRYVQAGLFPEEDHGWARMGFWLVEKLAAGDAAVRPIWEEGLTGLAVGLVNLYNCFAPQAIVIGGGLSAPVQAELPLLTRLVDERACLMPVPPGVLRFSENRHTIPLLGVAAVAGGWIGIEP